MLTQDCTSNDTLLQLLLNLIGCLWRANSPQLQQACDYLTGTSSHVTITEEMVTEIATRAAMSAPRSAGAWRGVTCHSLQQGSLERGKPVVCS